MDYVNSPEVRKCEETFRYRITKLIREKGIRMIDMPHELGITRGTIARYLSGERTPDFQHLIALALYFNVSVDWLIGMDIDKSMSQQERNILAMYIKADNDDKEIVELILKKYE